MHAGAAAYTGVSVAFTPDDEEDGDGDGDGDHHSEYA